MGNGFILLPAFIHKTNKQIKLRKNFNWPQNMNDLNSTDIQKWWFWPANCMWSTHLLVKILNTCNLKNWIQNCKEIELAWGQVHNLEDDGGGGVTISILLTRKLNCFQNLIKILNNSWQKIKIYLLPFPLRKIESRKANEFLIAVEN